MEERAEWHSPLGLSGYRSSSSCLSKKIRPAESKGVYPSVCVCVSLFPCAWYCQAFVKDGHTGVVSTFEFGFTIKSMKSEFICVFWGFCESHPSPQICSTAAPKPPQRLPESQLILLLTQIPSFLLPLITSLPPSSVGLLYNSPPPYPAPSLFLHSPSSYLHKSGPTGKQNKGHINIWWSAGLTSLRSPFLCSFFWPNQSTELIPSHCWLPIYPQNKCYHHYNVCLDQHSDFCL